MKRNNNHFVSTMSAWFELEVHMEKNETINNIEQHIK